MSQIERPHPDDKRGPQTDAIIGAAMEVHRVLGARFLETVYQCALAIEFQRCGVPFIRELAMPVYYKNEPLEVGYRADFVCFDEILVELKAMDRLTEREHSQIINYLAVSRMRRGLLLNFGTRSLEYKRFAGAQSVESVKSVGSRL
jgi:GxxExxY protein